MSRRVEEEDLWAGVREGNPLAFGVLFDRYADLVYNIAFRRTGRWDTAEEIVSAVFLEAWRQRGGVETLDGSVRPWLIGVAMNLIRRHWRQTDRERRATLRLVAEYGDQHDHASEVVARLDAECQMRAVLEAIDALAIDQREVIELWAWEGLTYEEISVSLGVPVGTVKSRLHRARERLEEINGTGPPDRASIGDGALRAVTDRQVGGEGVKR